MPFIVPNLNNAETRTTRLSALRFILDSAETVDSYCTDYLTVGDFGGIVDLENLAGERIERVARTLGELDAIVSSMWEYPLMEAVTAEAQLGVETVERARALAEAIRESIVTLAKITTRPASPDTGEIVDDEADTPAPRSAHTHTGFEAGAL